MGKGGKTVKSRQSDIENTVDYFEHLRAPVGLDLKRQDFHFLLKLDVCYCMGVKRRRHDFMFLYYMANFVT